MIATKRENEPIESTPVPPDDDWEDVWEEDENWDDDDWDENWAAEEDDWDE